MEHVLEFWLEDEAVSAVLACVDCNEGGKKAFLAFRAQCKVDKLPNFDAIGKSMEKCLIALFCDGKVVWRNSKYSVVSDGRHWCCISYIERLY